MLRLTCSITAAAFISAAALAQEETVVSGRILDAETGQPLTAATIIASDPDSGATLGGALTDEDGRFVLSGLPRGDYVIEALLAGYQPGET